jgi:hypothetical protein
MSNAPLRFEMWEWCQVPGSGYQVSGIRAIFILHHASCILHPYLNRAVMNHCRTALLPYCPTAVLPYCPASGSQVPGTGSPGPSAPSILHLAYPVCGFFEGRYLVPGTRYRVPAIWHLGPGTRHRSGIDAGGRTPSTEDRAWLLENAHTGFASCILYPTSLVGGRLRRGPKGGSP